MANVAVVGAQWGDEGKGRLVDWLAERADIVARYNGGHNAGHTLVVDGQTYKLALLPSGIVRGKPGVIGNGVALDPEALLAEITRLKEQGIRVTPELLSIADNAILVLPLHRVLDQAQESMRKIKIGTTMRGIGPAYEDKVGRRAIRVGDLADPDTLSAKLDALLAHHNPWLRGVGIDSVEKPPLLDNLLALAPRILPFVRPVWALLDEAMQSGKQILFEGSQAVMLDIDWGDYPFVTSSTTIAAGAAAGTGIAPGAIGTVLGVSKVYATRVGGGLFATELLDATGELLRARGQEYGVNTGRPRRCGWLDAAQLRRSIKIAGIEMLALTKLDVFDGMAEIKICTGYQVDGQVLPYLPSSPQQQATAVPVYECHAGWSQPTRGIRTLAQLPEQAIKFIRRIEALVEARIAIVTTGPERADTIVLEDPFGA